MCETNVYIVTLPKMPIHAFKEASRSQWSGLNAFKELFAG